MTHSDICDILRTILPQEQFDHACLLFREYVGETINQVRDLIVYPDHPDLTELKIRLWKECRLNRSYVRQFLRIVQTVGMSVPTKKFQAFIELDDN
jgi:hypothetical protein